MILRDITNLPVPSIKDLSKSPKSHTTIKEEL